MWFVALAAAVEPQRVLPGPRWRWWPIEDDADVVLRFTGDLDGTPYPCPCGDGRPGGVARIVALHEWLGPGLLVDAGGWLRATPDASGRGLDSVTMASNDAMRVALEGWDALGVGFRDLPGLGTPPATAVSATAAGGAPRWSHRVAGGVAVAVTSVSGAGMAHVQPEGNVWPDPVLALREALAGVNESDLVVVLGYDLPDPEGVASLPGVDVLVEARRDELPVPAAAVGDAIWVRAARGGWLGELRLWVEEGHVVAAVDRHLPLVAELPEDRALAALLRPEGSSGRKPRVGR
jgi:hypothetical protein